MNFRRTRKKIKIAFAKLNRAVTKGFWTISAAKSKNDRMVIKIVGTLLENKETRVHYAPNFYAPNSSRIYLHTKDKRYIVSFDRYSIRITNHRFFFSTDLRDPVGDELIKLATNRLEEDLMKLDGEVSYNEDMFLNEVYGVIKRKNSMSLASKLRSVAVEKSIEDICRSEIFNTSPIETIESN
jgi:hypothetical protein